MDREQSEVEFLESTWDKKNYRDECKLVKDRRAGSVSGAAFHSATNRKRLKREKNTLAPQDKCHFKISIFSRLHRFDRSAAKQASTDLP